jgi:hypothetical protein
MTAVGAIIMTLFGAVWWMIGAHASRRGSVSLYALGVLIAAALWFVAWRSSNQVTDPEEESRRGRLVGIASGIEGVLILLAVNVLQNVGKRDFVAPAVAIIIGLHFIPLARWLPAPFYYGTALLLVAAGGIGCLVQDSHERLLLVSFASATVLWLTAIGVLLAVRATANVTPR